jgi:hypothetical protein
MAGATMTVTASATPTTESQTPSVAGESVKVPNPAFHPTGYSGLRPLPPSGEFER